MNPPGIGRDVGSVFLCASAAVGASTVAPIAHTFESGNEAFFCSIHSRSSSSFASSIGGGSYSASICL